MQGWSEAEGRGDSRGDILIVEDDEVIRDGLRDVLADEGYCVRTAEHGRAALDVLAAGPEPGLILLDLMMPVMDGWQVLAALRQRAKHREAPSAGVVVCSAAIDHAAPKGAARYLEKPIRLDTLLREVGRLCPPPGHVLAGGGVASC